jgi:hypothetical protein
LKEEGRDAPLLRATDMVRGRRVSRCPKRIRMLMTTTLREVEATRPASPLLSGISDDQIWDATSSLIRGYRALSSPFGDDSAGHLEKGQYLTGRNLGWHVGEFINDRVPPRADVLFAAVDALIDAVIEPTKTFPDEESLIYRTPRGTNHGGPDYLNNDPSLIAHLVVGEAIRAEGVPIREAWERIQDAFGTDVRLPPHQSMFHRRQTNRKFVREWSFSGEDGELTSSREVVGKYPKVRHVNGVPTWWNTVMRPAFNEIKRRMRRLVWFKHGREQDLNDTFWGGWRFEQVINLDASTFDQHVFLALRERVVERLRPLLDRYGATEALRAVAKSHILTPAMFFGDEAFLADSVGIVTSGEVGTSIIDSIISCALTIAALSIVWSRSPLGVLHEFISRKHNGKWQGDDTLVGLSRRADREALAAACESMGFPVKTSDAAIFLMTHLPGPGSRAHGLAARAFVNTHFRERPQTSEAVELLGLASRMERCEADPLFSRVEDEIFANSWLAHRGLRNTRQVIAFTRSRDFAALFASENIIREGSKHWHEARAWAKGLVHGEAEDEEDGASRPGDAEAEFDSRDIWRYLEALGANLKIDVRVQDMVSRVSAEVRTSFSRSLDLFHELGKKEQMWT